MRENIIIGMIACMLLAACAGSTNMEKSWVSPDLAKQAYSHIMVMAVVDDDISRRAYEATLVKRIQESKGKNAIQANSLFPSVEDYKEQAHMESTVEKSGADLLIITSVIGVSTKTKYIPPRMNYMPSYGMTSGYYGYSAMSMQPTYTPGYTREETVVRLEITAFDVSSKKMIWAGTTSSYNASSDDTIINENIKLIVEDMKKAGVL